MITSKQIENKETLFMNNITPKALDSHLVHGASFGAALHIATKWIPQLWQVKPQISSPSNLNRSIFSGALAGAITREIFTDGQTLVQKEIAPRIYSAFSAIGSLAAGVSKIGLVSACYFGISSLEKLATVDKESLYAFKKAFWNEEPKTKFSLFEEATRAVASLTTETALSIMDSFPVSREISPQLRQIKDTCLKEFGPLLDSLPFEPMKLATIVTSLFAIQTLIKMYWKEIEKSVDEAKATFENSITPYTIEGLTAAEYACSHYLSAYLEKNLGATGCLFAALTGLPSLYFLRDAIKNKGIFSAIPELREGWSSILKTIPLGTLSPLLFTSSAQPIETKTNKPVEDKIEQIPILSSSDEEIVTPEVEAEATPSSEFFAPDVISKAEKHSPFEELYQEGIAYWASFYTSFTQTFSYFTSRFMAFFDWLINKL
jgi:hypothetical protein